MKAITETSYYKNCSSMQEADKLSDEYIESYNDDLQHYNKLKDELKQSRTNVRTT